MTGGTIRIELFGIARVRAGVAACEVEGASLEEALRALAARFPGLSPDVVRDGALTEHFVASLDGEKWISSPRAPLHPGDTLLILGAQAGG